MEDDKVTSATGNDRLDDDLSLGRFLRERRARLDPAALGFEVGRRRTPGLRREEVAQRAGISAVWYSWLERGRGGSPSPAVLERLADALRLAEAEREHLFLLALGRAPEPHPGPSAGVSLNLRRVLDQLTTSPAVVRTVTWDVVAWNRAAACVLTDWGALPAGERNILRRVFLDPWSRRTNPDWEPIARSTVGMLRADAARAGPAVLPFVQRLRHDSREFAAMWRDTDVRAHGEGERRLRHPKLGDIAFGLSSFAVHGRPDLVMLVHAPVTDGDERHVAELIAVG